MLPPLDRVRLAVARTRDLAGRVGTAGGAALLAASLTGPQPLTVALPAAALAAGGGYLVSVASADPQPHHVLKALYLAPSATLASACVGFQMAPGLRWWEPLTAAAWTGLTWWLRPSLRARDWISPPDTAQAVYEAATPVVQAAPAVDLSGPLEQRLAAFWEAYAAHEGGCAPATRLEQISVRGPRDWSAHIVAVHPGEPVPEISIPRLSALTDIPEHLIHLDPVPGSGAGRRLLRVGTAVTAPTTFEQMWAQQVAPAAGLSGVSVVAVRRGSLADADEPAVPLTKKEPPADDH